MGNSHGAPVCDPVGGKELSAVFSELDSEHHGWLTLRELLAASSVPGLVMPHSLPVLYYFDTEHDGNLTRAEFIALVQYCHAEKVKAEAELLRDKRFRDLIATASAGGVKDYSMSGRSSFRRFSSYSNVRSVYARSASASHTDSDVEAGSQGLSGLSLGEGGSNCLARSASADVGALGVYGSGGVPPGAPSGLPPPSGAPRSGVGGEAPAVQRCPSIAALSSAGAYGRSESRLMDAAAYGEGGAHRGGDGAHSTRVAVPGAAQAYNSFHSDDSATEQSSSVCEQEMFDQRGASSPGGGPGRGVYVESGSDLYDLPDPDKLAASGMRTGLSSESDSSSSSSSSSSGSSTSSRSSRSRGYPRVSPPSVPDVSGSNEYDLPTPPTNTVPLNVYVGSGSELYDLPDPDELAASGMRTGNSSESDSSSSSSSSTEDEAPHTHVCDAGAAAAAGPSGRDAVPSVVHDDGFELPDIDALAALGTRRGSASRGLESGPASSSDGRSNSSHLSAGPAIAPSTSQQRSSRSSRHRSGSRRHVDSSCSSHSCSSDRSGRSSAQGDAGCSEEAGASSSQGVLPSEGSFVPQHAGHGNHAVRPSSVFPEAVAAAAAAAVAGGLSDVTADHEAAVTAAAAAAASVHPSASVNDRTIGMFSSQREFDSVASSSGRLQRLRSDSDTSFSDSDLSDHVVSSLDAKSVTALDAAVIEKVTRANIAKLADQLHTEGSREAFMQWLWRLVDSNGTGVVTLDELRVFLEALSEDGIDLEELVFYKERGVPLEERILNEFDTSHSGLLTRDEFMVLADLVTREYEFWENRHLDCIGDYELGRTVGRGSSGVVRAAIHVVTRRKFAVKIIKKGNCSDLSRLDREIQSLTVVQHPNVVSLEEVLDSEDNTFLVMTLCGGGSLIDIVRLYPEERMPEATARFYLRQLFDALAYCHANGICHRDVRLDNIMLGNSGVLKLTDFGHSGIYTPGWDLFSTSLVGSIFNLSPEQIAGRCYSGEKIDVWSAGVLVYCLLVGHPPFYDSDTRKLIDSITTGTFEIPSFVSPSAADFIRLMINVVPDDRPPLSTMRRHPWFLEGPENAPVMDVVTIPVDPLYKWRPDLAEMIMAGTIHEHNLHFHLSDTHNPKSCPADLRGQDWALKCLCPNMDIKFSVSLFTKEPTEMAVSTGRCPASRLRPPATPRARSGEPTPSPRLLLSEDLPSGRGLGAGESSPSLVTFARTDALELNSASRPTAFGSLAAHEEAERGGPLVNPIFSSLPSVDASAGATSSEREMSGSDCGLTTPSTRRASLLHTPYSSEANDVDAGSSPAFSLGNPAAVARRGPMDSPSEFTLSPSRLMRSTSAVHLASTSYLDLDAGTADLRLGGLGGGETSGGDGGTISSDYRSDLMHLLRRSCSMQDRGEFITGARLKMTTSRTTDAFPYYCRLQPPPPPPAPPPVPQFLYPSGTPLRTATGRLLRPTCTSDESFVGLDPSLVDAGLEGAGGGVKVESDDDGYEEDGEWSSDGSAERRGAERRSRRRRRRTSGGTPIPPGLAGDGSSMAIPVPSAAVVAEGGVAENCPGGSPSWTVLANSPVGPGIVDRLSKHPSKRFTALQQPRRAGGAARPGENGPALDAGLPSIREATSVHPGPAFPPDESSPETLPVVAPSGPRSVEPRSFLERLEEDDDFQPFLEVRLQEGESGLFLRICRKLKTICDTKLAGAAERQKLRAP
ncbi:hypothetical protein I4F81_007405 [Pyropia yezoensis]|uniref:Uncharacterized protein n=1 Tax=Pyropia yezoensis TaxID=2788 RepID=A0ACC3C413_PYRYE|nr:hypothetical protein I4F81_007405 [Neopyropia yezoensis]